MTGFTEVFPELNVQAPTVAGQVPMDPTVLTRLRRQGLHDLAKAYEIPVKEDGTKLEILPALIAAEQQGVFKRSAIHPYYLKKAAYNSDRPYENTDWGNPPKIKRPDNAGDYRAMQKRAKELGLGRTCVGLKGPELAEAIRKAEHEQRQSESEIQGHVGHEALPGEGRPLDQSETADTIGQDSESPGPLDQE